MRTLTPTSNPTPEDIARAKNERQLQAWRVALSEVGRVPEEGPFLQDEREFRKWCRAVNRRYRKALRRIN